MRKLKYFPFVDFGSQVRYYIFIKDHVDCRWLKIIKMSANPYRFGVIGMLVIY